MTTLVVKLSEGWPGVWRWAADELKTATHEELAIAALEAFTRGLAAEVATRDRRRSRERRREPRTGKDRRDV